MNPIQIIARWLDRRGEESYRSRPDPYIRDVLEPRQAKLAERESRLNKRPARGESFLTDHMRGGQP